MNLKLSSVPYLTSFLHSSITIPKQWVNDNNDKIIILQLNKKSTIDVNQNKNCERGHINKNQGRQTLT